MPPLPSVEETLGYFDSLSNWGRWGSDDRLGTLNLITPEVRVAAAHLVTSGESISLSRNINPEDPDPLGTGLAVVQRFMGLGEVEHHMGKGAARFDGITEQVHIAAHGANTHLDGLAHYAWDGKTYNGFDLSEITSLGGSKKLSVHDAHAGIVSRGVLVDIPALVGVEWLDFSCAIGPEELEAALKRQGVVLRSGDVLLVHTGYVARTLAEGRNDPRRPNQPGLHAGCLPFLREHDIAALGSDAIQDVQPSGFPTLDLLRPIHTVGLVALGLWLIDNMELTELADKCRETNRYEFFFAMLPWRMMGVTSSATNPIALF
jgi:kynurenine formamidase